MQSRVASEVFDRFRQPHDQQKGLTLLELALVIALLSITITVISPQDFLQYFQSSLSRITIQQQARHVLSKYRSLFTMPTIVLEALPTECSILSNGTVTTIALQSQANSTLSSITFSNDLNSEKVLLNTVSDTLNSQGPDFSFSYYDRDLIPTSTLEDIALVKLSFTVLSQDKRIPYSESFILEHPHALFN